MDSEPDQPEAQPTPPARKPAARKPSTPRTPAATSGVKPPVRTSAKAPARPVPKTAANARPAAAKKPAAPRKTVSKADAVAAATDAAQQQPAAEEPDAQGPATPPATTPAPSARSNSAKSAAARKAQAARLAEVIKRAEATRVVEEATIVVDDAEAVVVDDTVVVEETAVVVETAVDEKPKPATPARKPAAKRAPARKPPASAAPTVAPEPVAEEMVVGAPDEQPDEEQVVVATLEPEPTPAPAVDTPEPETAVAVVDTAEREVVLQVTGLVKRFDDTTAVAGIDLSILAGSFFGIVGPNGAGKTTTLSMVTGLLKPDAGTITVHGANVWSNPVAAKRTMGVLPDRLRLFDRLTGAQLLYYSGVLHGLEKSVVRSRTSDLAAAFGLEDSLDRLVSDYSAGMTKKIAIAAAMIHSPRLLVFDEPFESVDPVSAANIIEILQKYVAAGGTVVISSHTMNLIERVCDSVAVVVNGAVLATGTMEQVRAGKTLEERFVELAGGRKAAEGMEWLHKFSD